MQAALRLLHNLLATAYYLYMLFLGAGNAQVNTLEWSYSKVLAKLLHHHPIREVYWSLLAFSLL